jgi:hypothetical protein
MKMLVAAAAAAALLAGCAAAPNFPAALPAASAPGASPAESSGEVIRHYIRSNRDGSEPENIVHFRPARTEVAVYKWMSKCNGAAYVTAQLDPEYWEAVALDAGKVGRDGSQVKFGRVVFEPNPDGGTRMLSARVDLPTGTMADTAEIPGGIPWFLFDYDLGDLNTYLQENRPEREFLFAFALVWPERADFLTHFGTLRAQHRGVEQRDGRAVRRFDLDSLWGDAGAGTLWTDPKDWSIVEAELASPNHPGMKDFRLKLARTELGGQQAWDALLKGHYANCPA